MLIESTRLANRVPEQKPRQSQTAGQHGQTDRQQRDTDRKQATQSPQTNNSQRTKRNSSQLIATHSFSSTVLKGRAGFKGVSEKGRVDLCFRLASPIQSAAFNLLSQSPSTRFRSRVASMRKRSTRPAVIGPATTCVQCACPLVVRALVDVSIFNSLHGRQELE